MAGQTYFVRIRGKITGPYDLAALQKLVRRGILSRIHEISADRAEWAPAGDFEDLFPSPSPLPPLRGQATAKSAAPLPSVPQPTTAVPVVATVAPAVSRRPTALASLVGITLANGEYHIDSEIGGGGMATVYCAAQSRLNRKVAVKILSRQLLEDRRFVQRFDREASILSSFSHANIVPVIDIGQERGLHFIVMGYIEGAGGKATTLRDLIEAGPLEIAQASRIMQQCLSALEYAHEKSIIHRDVKPGNILIDAQGNAYLADFGIASSRGKVHDPTLTVSGSTLGTARYMSPEQKDSGGQIDARSDLYSLGLVFYEMLVGYVPEAETFLPSEFLATKSQGKPFILPSTFRSGEIEQRIDQVILRAIQPDPAERFQSASEMLAALAEGSSWNGERPPTEASPSPSPTNDAAPSGQAYVDVQPDLQPVPVAASPTVAPPSPRAAQPHRPRNRRVQVTDPDITVVAGPADRAGSGGFEAGELFASADDPLPPEDIAVALQGDQTFIGRDASCHVVLKSLLISRRHARICYDGTDYVVEDLASTNGTFLNDRRLTQPERLVVGDALSIGPYHLTFDGWKLVSARSELGAEISICGLSFEVTDRETGRPKMLLSDISIAIRPRQFVGVLGTSGAGKSTLISAISGRRPATFGQVLLNGENLYQRFEALKASIGFVPQEVIFHDSLPLSEALRYTSRLRLSGDVSDDEIEANVNRVLQTVGLSENRGMIIKNLSGGQKKRVSIAMELLSQPRVLFLDEVTSGLDPHTEKQMMNLFRRLADSGITVICITHYANSAEICDEIAYLNKGRLAFYGSPSQFRQYFEVDRIESAYDKEDQKTPAQWAEGFRNSAMYQDVESTAAAPPPVRPPMQRQGIEWAELWRQAKVLTRRYLRILTIDRRNLLLLLGLPPLTAILLCILSSSIEEPESVVDPITYGAWAHKQVILCFGPIIIMFLLSMFGSVREIVKELSIYQHERFINLRVIPYLLSKVGPLAVIGAIQTLSVILIVNYFADIKAGSMFCQFLTLFLVSMCGMLLGLAISASVDSSDWAVILMIGGVIPQILFAGGLAPVQGASAFIGKGFISAYWALEALKTQVEDYYTSNHVGTFVLTGHSQGWGVGTGVLLLHVFVFAVLTFLLMALKDGPHAAPRVARSLKVLFDDVCTMLGGQRRPATARSR